MSKFKSIPLVALLLLFPMTASSSTKAETLYGWDRELGCKKFPGGVDDFLAGTGGDCGLVKEEGGLFVFLCKFDGQKSVVIAVRDRKRCNLIPKMQEKLREANL